MIILANIYIDNNLLSYLDIFSSIFLSLTAIIITLYSNVWSPKKKKIEVDILLDDFNYKSFVIVKNLGNKPVIISSLKLYTQKNLFSEKINLGERKNFWNIDKSLNPLYPDHAITYEPMYGNTNDIFGFPGHFFDVGSENRDYKVYAIVTDIDGKTFKNKLHYNLGEIFEIIQPAIYAN